MKLTDCLVILLVALVLQVQIVDPAAAATIDLPAPGSYAVFSRDADSAVWQLQTIQRGLKGTLVTNVHQYTELATGLNVWRNGKWQPSAEDIEISPDGTTAAATNGEHQVYFPGDVYSGNIRLVTPDG